MENKEHNLQDKRCESCGYMTYHREHIGCIRAAEQAQHHCKNCEGVQPDTCGFNVKQKSEPVLSDDEGWKSGGALWRSGFSQQKAEPLKKSGCPCGHDSDCAIHNMPAYPAGPCNCSVRKAFEMRFKHLGLERGRDEENELIYVHDLAQGAWLGFNAAMAAATNPFLAVPDGYALVPIEPTEEMIDAARKIAIDWADGLPNHADGYRAMLAAMGQPK